MFVGESELNTLAEELFTLSHDQREKAAKETDELTRVGLVAGGFAYREAAMKVNRLLDYARERRRARARWRACENGTTQPLGARGPDNTEGVKE